MKNNYHRTILFTIPLFMFFLIAVNLPAAKANNFDDATYYASPLEGRWDLTLHIDGKEFPSWLEVSHSEQIHWSANT